MRFFLFSIACTFLFSVSELNAQTPIDSVENVDYSQLSTEELRAHKKKLSQEIDSIYKNVEAPLWIALSNINDEIGNRFYEPEYESIYIGLTYLKADLESLNAILKSGANLGSISEDFLSLEYGFDFKGKRIINDLQIGLVFPNKVTLENGSGTGSDEEVEVGVSGGNFNWHIGYDIVNRAPIQFYPMLGLSLQPLSVNIDFTDNNVNDLPSVFTNQRNVHINKLNLGLDLGAKLDFRLGKPKSGGSGAILSLQGGYSTPIAEGHTKVNKEKTYLDIPMALRNTYLGISVKFYTIRRDFYQLD